MIFLHMAGSAVFIYSSTVLKYAFWVLLLYLSIFFLFNFKLLLHYNSKENIVLFT